MVRETGNKPVQSFLNSLKSSHTQMLQGLETFAEFKTESVTHNGLYSIIYE